MDTTTVRVVVAASLSPAGYIAPDAGVVGGGNDDCDIRASILRGTPDGWPTSFVVVDVEVPTPEPLPAIHEAEAVVVPTLLEALEGLTAWFADEYEGPMTVGACLDDARAAIARARAK